jgi:formylglycine-generating enzyme required for sulfatase activity
MRIYIVLGYSWDCSQPMKVRTYQVLGGCWNFGPEYCRLARRNGIMSGYRFNNLGFRLITKRKVQ